MIYTITSYEGPKPDERFDKRGPDDSGQLRLGSTGGDHRVIGYFTNQDDALRYAANGVGLHEALYNYLVVEEVPEGFYPDSKVLAWFKWNKKRLVWDRLQSQPYFARGLCNFSIG